MRTATLTFKSFSQSVISFAQFSASMFSSFIDVFLCSVDAAHMHSRDIFDQMSIFWWSRLMLLTYASHRSRSFFNSTSSLECARHMQFLKFNSTSRIFSNLGSTSLTLRQLKLVNGPFELITCWFTNQPKCEHTLEHSYSGMYSIFQQLTSEYNRCTTSASAEGPLRDTWLALMLGAYDSRDLRCPTKQYHRIISALNAFNQVFAGPSSKADVTCFCPLP